jgi:hypothetical protein
MTPDAMVRTSIARTSMSRPVGATAPSGEANVPTCRPCMWNAMTIRSASRRRPGCACRAGRRLSATTWLGRRAPRWIFRSRLRRPGRRIRRERPLRRRTDHRQASSKAAGGVPVEWSQQPVCPPAHRRPILAGNNESRRLPQPSSTTSGGPHGGGPYRGTHRGRSVRTATRNPRHYRRGQIRVDPDGLGGDGDMNP